MITRWCLAITVSLMLLGAGVVWVRGTAAPASATPADTQSSASADHGIAKARVTFKCGELALVGFVFKPPGAGPFPTLVWNHGSEKNPGTSIQFDSVARLFVPAGYVVFAPMRRGHGRSEGPYVVDQVKQEAQAHGRAAAAKLMVQLMEGPQLDDQLAGLAYVKKLAYVDSNRLVVAGCSYGGIETLLAAERGAGFKAAMAMCPGAKSWNGNKLLQDRLIKAVAGINIPVLLIHPEKDANVQPGYVLGQEFQRLGKPYGLKIFPPFGPPGMQGHCFGGAKGMSLWAPDALWFFDQVLNGKNADAPATQDTPDSEVDDECK